MNTFVVTYEHYDDFRVLLATDDYSAALDCAESVVRDEDTGDAYVTTFNDGIKIALRSVCMRFASEDEFEDRRVLEWEDRSYRLKGR